MPNDDLESRVASLEHEVARLSEHVALASSDAAAGRLLAAGADHDVSEVRAELRAHTQVLNALRETQLEFRETQLDHSRVLTGLRAEIGAQGQELTGLRAEVQESFATLVTGMAEVTTMLNKIAEVKNGS
ncbi:MAG: permease [Pseudonocardiaceae bacterium]